MRAFPYKPEHADRWNSFVRASKNGTFLLERGYLEYHADRFRDASIVVADDEGEWHAVLPASLHGSSVISHGGLTYGGFITDVRMTAPRMLSVFDSAAQHFREQRVASVLYKCIPHPYHRVPAEEDRYGLFRQGARFVRCDVISAIHRADRLPFQERRRRGVKKALKHDVVCSASDDFGGYWKILESVLNERHGAQPVHTLVEITSLRTRFPDNIQLWTAVAGSRIVAGVVLYVTDRVVRCQYIAALDEGREIGALDLLFDRLLSQEYSTRPWFEFGSSNEDHGKVLNAGLVEQKEGFGARTVAHEFFEWPIS